MGLAVSPEDYYDVVMRAALVKDFNTSNASFRLQLSPPTSVYTPNVGQKEDPLGGESSAYVQGKGDTKFIEIDKVQCAYQVFQFQGVDAANQKVLKKKWKIDVPGFSFLNNLAEEEPTLRNRDLKMGEGMGPPRVELRTRHLKRTPIADNLTDLTQDEPAGGPTKKKDDTFAFPI